MLIWIALFRVLAIPNEEKSIRVKTNLREQYQNDVYQKLWPKVIVPIINSLVLYKRDSSSRGTLRSIRIPRLAKIPTLYRDLAESLEVIKGTIIWVV